MGTGVRSLTVPLASWCVQPRHVLVQARARCCRRCLTFAVLVCADP
jgi:hypothetical protein